VPDARGEAPAVFKVTATGNSTNAVQPGKSSGARRAANGGYADVVAAGEFVERSVLRAASGGVTRSALNFDVATQVPLGRRSTVVARRKQGP
jgi:hypothetical protein